MVSVIVSKWVGDAFGRDGIYDEQVSLRAVAQRDFCFCCTKGFSLPFHKGIFASVCERHRATRRSL